MPQSACRRSSHWHASRAAARPGAAPPCCPLCRSREEAAAGLLLRLFQLTEVRRTLCPPPKTRFCCRLDPRRDECRTLGHRSPQFIPLPLALPSSAALPLPRCPLHHCNVNAPDLCLPLHRFVTFALLPPHCNGTDDKEYGVRGTPTGSCAAVATMKETGSGAREARRSTTASLSPTPRRCYMLSPPTCASSPTSIPRLSTRQGKPPPVAEAVAGLQTRNLLEARMQCGGAGVRAVGAGAEGRRRGGAAAATSGSLPHHPLPVHLPVPSHPPPNRRTMAPPLRLMSLDDMDLIRIFGCLDYKER